MCFKRKKRLPERTLNIWNCHDFAMVGLGEKSRIIAMIKHSGRCLKWSRQRVVRGYAEECKDEAIDMLKEYFFSLWD